MHVLVGISGVPRQSGGCAAGAGGAASSPLFGAPVIHFIGPLRATAGKPVLLVWKVGWPSTDAHDDPLGMPPGVNTECLVRVALSIFRHRAACRSCIFLAAGLACICCIRSVYSV